MKKQKEHLKKEQPMGSRDAFFYRPNRPTLDEHMKLIDEWARHRFDKWDFEKTKQVIFDQIKNVPEGTEIYYLKQNGFKPVFRREFNDLATPDEFVEITIPPNFKQELTVGYKPT
jgi:hypothetical protein